jgi:phage portal protein BeeE
VLKHPTRLTEDQAAAALKQWFTARMARRPGLLTGQWEIQDLQIPSAQDSLLLDGLAYIDTTVARVWGVPPSLLNVRAETGSLTYSTTRDELIRWLNLSLYPTWLARLEDAFTEMLPRGQQAAFDTSNLGVLGLQRPGADEGRAELGGPLPTTNGEVPA